MPGATPRPAGPLIVLGGIALAIILFFFLRHFYFRYNNRKHAYQQAGNDDDHPNTLQINRHSQGGSHSTTTATATETRSQTTSDTSTAGVDRNTSVRSVMTLPVYRPKATDSEQVLGREGERDGIDVVVEMRTAEEEEALRDEEMEALYQIRAARRRQIAEREERRRQRQRAREANDAVALRELREQTRGSAGRNTSEIEELRGEHDRIRGTRQRAVSSVSYADVGIARADGTRVRANSTESTERVGLLSDTASIAADSHSLFRRRDRSASATLSIDTSLTAHGRPDSPGVLTTGGSGTGGYSLTSANRARSRSRASSAATTPRIPTPSPGTTPHAGSPPEIIEPEDADMGDMGMPPPGYDEVSLDEFTPMHSRRNSDVSRPVSPYPDPPPDYPGRTSVERRNQNRLSTHLEDLAAQSPSSPSSGSPQVPQIVIEPSSARP
ncbi:hypothetical protein CHGG_01345 [Chaetomium globosum CBS 148.51]|uniref:Uncharacterized protein n=1 Tax=Chaetomium globosum (strain ATCC 6205 / CBS 148.51 / DSM 1962 / NBRC 6347 / NRRL 1970) TaxID=306901 RepID=Q2HEK9_CHAGB|nr:uncharacterized protein CHGG_01345 [Chaetomium globosum CBS 148.51]EAQ93110.1 hypothetical protein CHGG_01345 [Chaetomium globosum CBS 148.51]